ncbi:hypothetical protein MMC09_006785 [Bachmanniomyces sp. S44760]|nr:hypothetical protein [Bachmanniomyces sp. S44760]
MKRRLIVVATICSFLLIVLLFRNYLRSPVETQALQPPRSFLPSLGAESQPSCYLDHSSLSLYKLSSPYTLSRKYLRPIQKLSHKKYISYEEIDADLFTDQVTVDNDSGPDSKSSNNDAQAKTRLPPSSCATTSIVVPAFDSQPPDGSSILMGMATSVDRFKDSIPHIVQWAAHTGLKIVVSLEEQNSVKISTFEARLRTEYGLNVHFIARPGDWNARAGDLVPLLASQLEPETKWVFFVDDDTYFPSLRELQLFLSHHPDPLEESQMIGGLTESHQSIAEAGILPLGGAGIILSRPLLSTIASPAIWEACQAKIPTNQASDYKISRCVTELTPVKLTPSPYLHQLDLFSDASGFYESGRRMLSLHHWKSWHETDVVALGLLKPVCGDLCPLKRWKFRDNSVLTNGYSAVRYPTTSSAVGKDINATDGMPDLNKMEMTFHTEPGRFEEGASNNWKELSHSLTPFRLKLDEGTEKLSWRLRGAKEYVEGVRHIYVRPGGEHGNTDNVLDVIWLHE